MARKKYNPYRYQNFVVIRAVDGDTVEVEVDVGFRSRYRDNFRLSGIDTPERGQDGFTEATERLSALLMEHQGNLEMEVTKRDKYGRYLAEFKVVSTGLSVNQQMVVEGYAKEYHGGKR